jgi:hypothetical protein
MRKNARIAVTSPLTPPAADSSDADVRPPPGDRDDGIAPPSRRAWGYPSPVFTSFEWCLPDD